MIIKLSKSELAEFIKLKMKAEQINNNIVGLRVNLDKEIGNLKFTEGLQDDWMCRFSRNRKLKIAALSNAKFDTSRGVIILPDSE